MLYNSQSCDDTNWLESFNGKTGSVYITTLRLLMTWWPGDTRTRAISNHGIVLFLLKYPILCNSRTILGGGGGGAFFLYFFILLFFADVCTEFHEIFKIGRTCYKEQLVTFGGSSGAPSHNYSGFFKVCEQHLREYIMKGLSWYNTKSKWYLPDHHLDTNKFYFVCCISWEGGGGGLFMSNYVHRIKK